MYYATFQVSALMFYSKFCSTIVLTVICQLSCLMIRGLKDEKSCSSLLKNLEEDSQKCEIIESQCLWAILDAWRKWFTAVELRILKLTFISDWKWIIKIKGLKPQCHDIVKLKGLRCVRGCICQNNYSQRCSSSPSP